MSNESELNAVAYLTELGYTCIPKDGLDNEDRIRSGCILTCLDSCSGYLRKHGYNHLANEIDMDKNWLESFRSKLFGKKADDMFCRENCKGYQETGKCFADGECEAKAKLESEFLISEKAFKRIVGVLQEEYGFDDLDIVEFTMKVEQGLNIRIPNHWY